MPLMAMREVFGFVFLPFIDLFRSCGIQCCFFNNPPGLCRGYYPDDDDDDDKREDHNDCIDGGDDYDSLDEENQI